MLIIFCLWFSYFPSLRRSHITPLCRVRFDHSHLLNFLYCKSYIRSSNCLLHLDSTIYFSYALLLLSNIILFFMFCVLPQKVLASMFTLSVLFCKQLSVISTICKFLLYVSSLIQWKPAPHFLFLERIFSLFIKNSWPCVWVPQKNKIK